MLYFELNRADVIQSKSFHVGQSVKYKISYSRIPSAVPEEERRSMKKDITKKQLEDYNDVYADIFNALLFDGEKVLEEEYLVPLPTESFTRNSNGSLRQGNRDIRKADKRNGCYRLICGEENQENRENTMPQRIMGYDYAAYEEQIKALMDKNEAEGKRAVVKRIHDDQRLAPVVTAVLYWGEKKWSRPRCLYDMLEFPKDYGEKIKPFVADYPMNLIEMARLPEAVRNRLQSDFRLIADYAACKDKIEKLEELIADRNHVIRHPEEFLDALSAVAGDKRYERVKIQLRERAEEKKEDITMCLIAEALENKGIQEGLKKGRQEGLSKGRREGAKSKAETIARNMFARDMSAEDTAAICEESLEQIRNWFAGWRKEVQ